MPKIELIKNVILLFHLHIYILLFTTFVYLPATPKVAVEEQKIEEFKICKQFLKEAKIDIKISSYMYFCSARNMKAFRNKFGTKILHILVPHNCTTTIAPQHVLANCTMEYRQGYYIYSLVFLWFLNFYQKITIFPHFRFGNRGE
jgi:hypothetical protein